MGGCPRPGLRLASRAPPFSQLRWLRRRRQHHGLTVLLLVLLFSLPGEGNQSVCCRPWNYRDVNRRIRRPSVTLEPGIYHGGTPLAQVSSDPFGFNLSSPDCAISSYYASSVMFPDIQDMYSHPLRAPVDFFCASKDTCGVVMSWHLSSERGAFPRRRSTGTYAGRHRKLLGSSQGGSSTKRNLIRRRQQVLPQEPRVDGGVRISKAATAAAALALFSLFCAIAGLVLWCTRRRDKSETDETKLVIHQIEELCRTSATRRYRRRELAAAARGFAEAAKIGRGGFGTVYRGFLADQERHVAIKVMSSSSSSVQAQGVREFLAEVKVMTRLRHRNVVQLLGWSGEPGPGGGLMLVYELVPNGSLDRHLHDPQRLLPWTDRYKIALGVGSAVLYLHTECEQCVLHGDIKPANVLLDASCNAKLGDFGLARLVDHGTDDDPCTTENVAGTPGYMDPELVNSGRPSAEADVFSFGVVLLELASGRRPTAARQPNATTTTLTTIVMPLIDWVRAMYRKNTVVGAADRRLDGEFDEQEMRRVLVAGLWCTHHDQRRRPPIAHAMDLLRRQDVELPVLGELRSPAATASVRSLEEIAYGDLDLSAEDSGLEDSSADTAYHTSEVSTLLVVQC